MRRSLIPLVVLGCLAGCGSVALDEGQHIVGVVMSVTSASTPAARPGPGPFMVVGAAGGLVGPKAQKSADGKMYLHNRLYVKTSSGEVIVDTGEYFPEGSCVEITPLAGEQSPTFFSYGSARVLRSDQC